MGCILLAGAHTPWGVAVLRELLRSHQTCVILAPASRGSSTRNRLASMIDAIEKQIGSAVERPMIVEVDESTNCQCPSDFHQQRESLASCGPLHVVDCTAAERSSRNTLPTWLGEILETNQIASVTQVVRHSQSKYATPEPESLTSPASTVWHRVSVGLPLVDERRHEVPGGELTAPLELLQLASRFTPSERAAFVIQQASRVFDVDACVRMTDVTAFARGILDQIHNSGESRQENLRFVQANRDVPMRELLESLGEILTTGQSAVSKNAAESEQDAGLLPVLLRDIFRGWQEFLVPGSPVSSDATIKPRFWRKLHEGLAVINSQSSDGIKNKSSLQEIHRVVVEPHARSLSLVVRGPGGGTWRLQVVDQEIASAIRAVPFADQPRWECHEQTINSIQSGRTTLKQEVAAGRVLICTGTSAKSSTECLQSEPKALASGPNNEQPINRSGPMTAIENWIKSAIPQNEHDRLRQPAVVNTQAQSTEAEDFAVREAESDIEEFPAAEVDVLPAHELVNAG